jgi:transcriptional regulator with XRE-family HTH domain
MSLGKRLRQFRNERGYSRETAATLLNVSFSSLEKWESDKRVPTLKMAQKLSVLYGVDVDELIGTTLSTKAEKARLARLAQKYEKVLMQFESTDEKFLNELLSRIEAAMSLFPREDARSNVNQSAASCSPKMKTG